MRQATLNLWSHFTQPTTIHITTLMLPIVPTEITHKDRQESVSVNPHVYGLTTLNPQFGELSNLTSS
ncbi:hypothetical protein HYC85_006638 [Camellia sinensis]|uniref:Uncharacterized protein n=1 Tax=Camellia sinensis TaxID=4442 RepID=A0A7J7HLL9_CAMSI|nr:hypothetical protein HYC85_006638 [Camellia sinensis]